MTTLRRASTIVAAAAVLVLATTPIVLAQGARPAPAVRPVEIGRGSEIPDSAISGEAIILDLMGIMSSADTFEEVRVRRMDLVTIPPLRVVKIDAYARSNLGAGITAPFRAKKDLADLRLSPGEWTLRFNEAFGEQHVFEKKLTITTALPLGDVEFETIARGVGSGMRTPRQAVARTQAEWDALWREHVGRGLPTGGRVPPAPAIDFDTHVVIADFMGTRNTGGYATTINAIQRSSRGYIVDVLHRSPGPGEIVTMAITWPFHMVKAPKPTMRPGDDVAPSIQFRVRAAPDPVRPGPVTFETIAQGAMSRIRSTENVVIKDTASWDALWRRHTGFSVPPPRPGGPELLRLPSAPAVDFTREMVVARFMGTRNSGGFGTEIQRISRDATNDYTVSVVDRSPAPGMPVTRVITSPFHMVRVTRTEGQVAFDVREGEGEAGVHAVAILQSSDIPERGVADEEIILGLDGRLGPNDVFREFRVRRMTLESFPPQEVIVIDALATTARLGGGLPRSFGRKLDVGPLAAGEYTLRINAELGGADFFTRKLHVAAAPDGDEVPIETIAAGDRSGITDARSLVIRSPRQWQALWAEHQGVQTMEAPPVPLPAVDFSREMVIARFQGRPGPGKTGIRNVTRTGDDYLVNVDEVLFDIPANVRMAPTSAFHIVRAPINRGNTSFNVVVDDRRAGSVRPEPIIADRSDITATGAPGEAITLGLSGDLPDGRVFHEYEVKRATRMGSMRPGGPPFTEEIIMVNAYSRMPMPGQTGPGNWGRKLDVGPLGDGVYTLRFNAELGAPHQFDRQLTVSAGREVAFETIDQGRVSAMRGAGEQVARTQAEWEQMWRNHAGDPSATPPAVDMDGHIVIGRFMGTSAPSTTEIVRIDHRGSDYVVNVLDSFSWIPPFARIAPTSAFHIVKAPTITGAVRFEIETHHEEAPTRVRAVEIAEGSSVVPDRIATGEDLVLKLRGLMRVGDRFEEVRIRQLQLERFPPINVIQVDAFVRNARFPGIVGTETGWDQEKNVGPLPDGEYSVRFNGEFGSAEWSRQVIVGRGGDRLISGTVSVNGRRIAISQSLPALDGNGRTVGRPVIEVLNVVDAPAEVARYLRILDGKQVTVLAKDGPSSDSIEVERLMEPSLTQVVGTAGVAGAVAQLRTRRETFDVGGRLRGAMRQFDGESVSAWGFIVQEHSGNRELVGVSMDARPGNRRTRVQRWPMPWGGSRDRVGPRTPISIEGSVDSPWFGRWFFVRYKDRQGRERTGWIAGRQVEPRSARGMLRALEESGDEGD